MNYNEIEKNLKLQIINQNIYHSRYGNYKNLPLYKPVKFKSSDINVLFEQLNKIPQVFVINKHPIHIIEELGTKCSPVILNTVGREFDGTKLELCNGLRDHTFILRTNFNAVLGKTPPFPIEDTECIYIKNLSIIRGKKLNGLNLEDIQNFSTIITSPFNKPNDNTDYIKTVSMIDSVFKIAINEGHGVLILSTFGDNDSDIIKIYNLAILKYGHLFTSIIIGIPEWETELFSLYNKHIIIPNKIVDQI